MKIMSNTVMIITIIFLGLIYYYYPNPQSGLSLSPPQRLASTGNPNKKSNDREITSALGKMGRGKRWESLFLSFPFPSSHARFLFSLSPAPLQHKEASGEETGFV